MPNSAAVRRWAANVLIGASFPRACIAVRGRLRPIHEDKHNDNCNDWDAKTQEQNRCNDEQFEDTESEHDLYQSGDEQRTPNRFVCPMPPHTKRNLPPT